MKSILITLIIAITVLGSVLGSVYMYTTYLSSRMEVVQQQNADRVAQLRSCLNTQDTNYYANWNSVCKGLGQEDNCALPADQTLLVEGRLERNQNNCIDLYNYSILTDY